MRLFHLLAISAVCFGLTSCLSSSKPPTDSDADSKLGAEAEEETGYAQQTLDELKEERLKEQKRALERQITDIDTRTNEPVTTT